MKLSISLTATDVAYLDRYARERGLASRSAVLQHAVQALRTVDLSAEYAAAFDGWSESDAALWDNAVADSLEADA